MLLSKKLVTNLRIQGLAVCLMLVLTACGGDQSSADSDAEKSVDSAAKPKTPATQSTVVESEAKAAVQEESVGNVAFAVDGVEKSLEYIPKSASYYTKSASQFHAYVESGSSEHFFVTFMAIDLKKHSFPASLPLPRDPKNPNIMAAMASVGFGYINTDGVEWAGPGKIWIESMEGGLLQGSFDQVLLPHTEQELPAVTLNGGVFRVRIDE